MKAKVCLFWMKSLLMQIKMAEALSNAAGAKTNDVFSHILPFLYQTPICKHDRESCTKQLNIIQLKSNFVALDLLYVCTHNSQVDNLIQ